jgi:hypothetical protein
MRQWIRETKDPQNMIICKLMINENKNTSYGSVAASTSVINLRAPSYDSVNWSASKKWLAELCAIWMLIFRTLVAPPQQLQSIGSQSTVSCSEVHLS